MNFTRVTTIWMEATDSRTQGWCHWCSQYCYGHTGFWGWISPLFWEIKQPITCFMWKRSKKNCEHVITDSWVTTCWDSDLRGLVSILPSFYWGFWASKATAGRLTSPYFHQSWFWGTSIFRVYGRDQHRKIDFLHVFTPSRRPQPQTGRKWLRQWLRVSRTLLHGLLVYLIHEVLSSACRTSIQCSQYCYGHTGFWGWIFPLFWEIKQPITCFMWLHSW